MIDIDKVIEAARFEACDEDGKICSVCYDLLAALEQMKDRAKDLNKGMDIAIGRYEDEAVDNIAREATIAELQQRVKELEGLVESAYREGWTDSNRRTAGDRYLPQVVDTAWVISDTKEAISPKDGE